MDSENRLIEWVGSNKHNPQEFCAGAYQWNEGELTGSLGLRPWQSQIMTDIKDHFTNPITKKEPLKIAVASGHGIGKSSLISMIMDWGMSTCVDCKIVVTANTETQLRTKTWPEVSKWFRESINSHWFKVTATSIYALAEGHERTWRADAIAWSENNTEAFAGLHNKGRRIILIFDEASNISDKVWEVAEGAMTDENTEIIWIAFGNPTKNTGRFRECFGRFAHRWKHYQIDSRTVDGTNKKEIAQWVADYGEDSDFVRIRVKGEFPRSGSMQFISSELVDAARKRLPEAYRDDPLVMGVDVARFGDDQTVIVIRRGRDAVSIPWITMRGADTMTVAAKVSELYNFWHPDAIFIDGGGVGGGVIDRLRMLRLPVIEVQFGSAASKDTMTNEGRVVYANKRAEMWGNMRDWLRGGSIPDKPELEADLCGVEYGYTLKDGLDAIILEKKSDMKKRGLASPDLADALCFVANTLISTPKGEIPIQNLSEGDEVVTPFGVTKICKLWTSNTTELTTVSFSQGATLSGKGEHNIFTWKSGQTRLDALSLDNEIVTINNSNLLWKFLSILSTWGKDIQFKPLVDTIRVEKNVTALAFFIAIFGQIFMEKFQKIAISITKISAGIITTFPIWNALTRLNISVNTQWNRIKKGFLNLLQILPWRKLRSGIGQKKGWNGIANTLSIIGEMLKRRPNNAQLAAKSMKRIWEIRNTVVMRALKELLIGGISLILRTVCIVAKNLLQTAIGRQSVVPVCVQTENVEPTLVYNLTLEKHNAYYANGILVYNCLTFAYTVQKSAHSHPYAKSQSGHQVNYDSLSLDRLQQDTGGGSSNHRVDYDPLQY